jgi:hypothetical protein
MKKFGLSIFPALLFGTAIAASPATAAVLYDNGAVSGTSSDGLGISGGFGASDSFTLAHAATVTGFNFGAFTFTGQTVTTVDFGIVTDPHLFTVNGTASVTNSLVGHPILTPYDVSEDSFTTSINLAAGTYYLVLQNAVTSGGDPAFWQFSGGPSTAYESINHGVDDGQVLSSNSFQVLGVTSAVPEPSTWAMMILGFFGLGYMGYRRRSSVTA